MFALLTMATALVTSQTQLDSIYHFEEVGGRWWIVAPDGTKFWSWADCCTNMGTPADKYDESNRSYSGARLFADDVAWATDTTRKLRAWGQNSIGGWSATDAFRKIPLEQRLPYFEVLHLGSYARLPFEDIFGKDVEATLEKAAKDQIEKLRDDPMLVGYFTDNELGWWPGALLLAYWKMPASTPGHRRLLEVVRRVYKDDFEEFRRDWDTKATSFEMALDQAPAMKAGADGMRLVEAWTGEMARHYYTLCRKLIRRYDSKRPILGDRYIQYYSLPVVREAKGQVEAISTNLGADWNDGTNAPFFLSTLHSVAAAPVLVTEFYMCANENRSGNKNDSPHFPVVQTQAEREISFERNVRSLASLPYVVGAHWFQFYDEPEHGRGDGENFNMGLVDIAGRPYEGMVDAMRHLDVNAIHASAGSELDSRIPRAGAEAERGLRFWPKPDAWLPSLDAERTADMAACYDDEGVWLAAMNMEYVEPRLYADGLVPEEDLTDWRVRLGDKRIRIRFGSGRAAEADDPEVKVFEKTGLKHTVWIHVPTPTKPGAEIPIEADLFTHGRAHHFRWKLEGRLR